VHQPSVVADHAVSAHQQVVGNRVPEHLNTKRVSDDFLSLFVKVGVDKGNVVVAADAVTECG
jgi:hypothetical protein